ncbi:hypothetical protein [uncultured Bacteroides sp.]|uniref:hypothetical protein n=1 Tax=uncultured Bacteroides sp. TaxID=162156 RepID=UPI0025E1C56A|nr:hypothetical protein [uncultured Bacteroides sp.]
MELKSLLLKEVDTIINDDELIAEALKALRKLRHKPQQVVYKDTEVSPPCNYSNEYVRERASNALRRYEQSEYATQEEMMKRIERWK